MSIKKKKRTKLEKKQIDSEQTTPILAPMNCLSKARVDEELNNYQVKALIDTGSSNSYSI